MVTSSECVYDMRKKSLKIAQNRRFKTVNYNRVQWSMRPPKTREREHTERSFLSCHYIYLHVHCDNVYNTDTAKTYKSLAAQCSPALISDIVHSQWGIERTMSGVKDAQTHTSDEGMGEGVSDGIGVQCI